MEEIAFLRAQLDRDEEFWEACPDHAQADQQLRDVDAKRRIIVRCQEEMLSGNPRLIHFCKQTLRELALPYANHPGYEDLFPATRS